MLLEPSGAAMQRLGYAQALAESHLLSTVMLVELYRTASNDADRELALDAMSGSVGSPYRPEPIAGWIAHDLTAFLAAKPSPAIHAKLQARLTALEAAKRH